MHYYNYPPPHPVIITDQRDVGGGIIAFAWVIAIFSGFYMLPWAIAATRGKANYTSIGFLNFLLGWTVIGWIIALVMACGSHRVVSGTVHPGYPAPGAHQW